jgi:hypothetical protein
VGAVSGGAAPGYSYYAPAGLTRKLGRVSLPQGGTSLIEPPASRGVSASLKTRWLVQDGGRLVKHGRYYRLLLAERSPRRHAAAVWSHAGQDCGPILSSGVGEPPTHKR